MGVISAINVNSKLLFEVQNLLTRFTLCYPVFIGERESPVLEDKPSLPSTDRVKNEYAFTARTDTFTFTLYSINKFVANCRECLLCEGVFLEMKCTVFK